MRTQLRAPTLESLFVGAFSLLGLRIGTLPIGDNSAFVHIRTGIDIVAGRGIPTTDPYSFTAAGHPWVIQSWLASAAYGVAHRVGDMAGIVALNGMVMAALAFVIARLARAGSPLRTFAAAGLAIGAGISYWSPRPLVLGLLCFALLVAVVDRDLPVVWLIPLAWIWVNTHGSFVLGLGWLALRVGGEMLDAGSWSAARRRFGAMAAFVVGIVAATVNPVGVRIVAFPFALASRRGILDEVAEWRSPNFQDALAFTSLVFLAGSAAVLFRTRSRWADVIPIVAFVGSGLYAQRNLPVAAIVLAPALGRALAADASSPADRPRVHLAIGGLMLGLAALFLIVPFTTSAVDLEGYPVAALAAIDADASDGGGVPGARMAHSDVVGGLLILREGRGAGVFIDDRFDMYPASVMRDYLTLLDGKEGAIEVLDRHEIDVVLWERGLPLGSVLVDVEGWTSVYRDHDWQVFRRTN